MKYWSVSIGRERSIYMTDKKEQRRLLKEKIAALGDEERKSFSRAICDRVLSSNRFREARSLFVYRSIPGEPDTLSLIENALESGKKVYLPRIEGENMFCVPYSSGETLRKNHYGIEEPAGEPFYGEIDLAIIPLLGFDKNKNRLGRGKGYYDRFLRVFGGQAVALAFSAQEIPEVAADEWDVRPSSIVTEEGEI